jgi:hypothetical protein
MSMLGDAMGRTPRRRPAEPPRGDSAGVAGSAPAQVPALPPPGDGSSELRRRRDALAEQVTELHWDLGGLAYEMAIRDHFRLDVLVRRAAVLQERDAELAEIERLLRLEESASAGSCQRCRAPHSRGALFCWQCGATLMERSPSAAASASRALAGDRDDSTAVMDALLAPDEAAVGDAGVRGSRVDPFGNE